MMVTAILFDWWNLKVNAPRSRKSSNASFVSASSVPAEVELLDHRVVLSAATIAPNVIPPASNHSVEALLKGESDFIKFEDAAIKAESIAIQHAGNQIPASVAAYVISIDNALSKINSDLVGQSSTTLGGINGAIVANYPKFAAKATAESVKIQSEIKALAKVEASLTTIANSGAAGSLTSREQRLLQTAHGVEQHFANKFSHGFTKLEPSLKGTNLESLTTPLGTDLSALAAL